MRYLLAGAFCILSQTAVAEVDQACVMNCTGKGYAYAYCQEACSYGSHSAGSVGGFAEGWMRTKQHQAEMEQAAAQKRLIEEQTRALELENQRREAELRQASGAAPTTSAVPQQLSTGGSAGLLAAMAQWQAAAAPRKGRYPDFEAVVFAPDVSMSPDMIQCMAHSPYAADIAYYLGKHKDEAAKIASMSFLDAAGAIREIEGKVASPGISRQTH